MLISWRIWGFIQRPLGRLYCRIFRSELVTGQLSYRIPVQYHTESLWNFRTTKQTRSTQGKALATTVRKWSTQFSSTTEVFSNRFATTCPGCVGIQSQCRVCQEALHSGFGAGFPAGVRGRDHQSTQHLTDRCANLSCILCGTCGHHLCARY